MPEPTPIVDVNATAGGNGITFIGYSALDPSHLYFTESIPAGEATEGVFRRHSLVASSADETIRENLSVGEFVMRQLGDGTTQSLVVTGTENNTVLWDLAKSPSDGTVTFGALAPLASFEDQVCGEFWTPSTGGCLGCVTAGAVGCIGDFNLSGGRIIDGTLFAADDLRIYRYGVAAHDVKVDVLPESLRDPDPQMPNVGRSAVIRDVSARAGVVYFAASNGIWKDDAGAFALLYANANGCEQIEVVNDSIVASVRVAGIEKLVRISLDGKVSSDLTADVYADSRFVAANGSVYWITSNAGAIVHATP
jgi:hypothetical protein